MKSFKLLRPLLCGAALLPLSLQAANTQYSPGDLVLFFQQEGGTNTIYVKLGVAATDFRGAAIGPGAPNLLNIVNISSQLTSAFGAGWASDANIYAGVAGVYTNTETPAATNGDPGRTVYVSSPRQVVGTVGQASSQQKNGASDGAMSAASSGILGMNTPFANGPTQQVGVFPTSTSQIDEKNPFLSAGIQGTAFTAFAGGVQQRGSAGTIGVFGDAGNVEFALDVYRIYADTFNLDPNRIVGPLREGTYEGTITLDASGNVSFISQGDATSAYDTWMATFPSITLPADKLSSADPDDDGATNLEEFGFGGDPSKGADNGIRLTQTVDADSDTQKDITLTLEVRSGATFSASGNDLVSAVIDDVTYRIEGSLDLANWDSTVSEVAPLGSGSPSTGYVFKTFRLNAGNGLTGKGFLRATVVK